MIKRLSWVLSLGLAAIVLLGPTSAQRPAHSIKEVMEKGMKSGLLRNVISGQATSEQRQELLGLLQSLAQNRPPKGSAENWRVRTTKMYQAAQAGDYAALKDSSRCLTCHKEHK